MKPPPARKALGVSVLGSASFLPASSARAEPGGIRRREIKEIMGERLRYPCVTHVKTEDRVVSREEALEIEVPEGTLLPRAIKLAEKVQRETGRVVVFPIKTK